MNMLGVAKYTVNTKTWLFSTVYWIIIAVVPPL
jgi:hypothetical protein